MAQYITYKKPVEGSEIVTLEMAKDNSRIEFDDENTLLQLFVDAATAEIENYIGAPVLEREVEIIESTWTRSVVIPFDSEIVSVEWLDKADNATAIPAADYDHFANELTIGIDKPSDFHRLKVVVKAGYANDAIPADIQRAALMIFSYHESYRENMPVKLNTSAQALLRPYKMY